MIMGGQNKKNVVDGNSSAFHDVEVASKATMLTTPPCSPLRQERNRLKLSNKRWDVSQPAPKLDPSALEGRVSPAPPTLDDAEELNNNNNKNNNSKYRMKDVCSRIKACLLSSSNSKAFVSCVLYSFCSVSMVLSNKSLATGDIDLNLLIVVFQAFFAVVCVETCKRLKIVEHYDGFNTKTAMQWAPVNIFFCCMLFSGMTSLQHNSVPMVTIFKNVTNIVTATGDYFFFGNNTNDPLIILSFAITLGGAVFAAKNDIMATPLGLFWMVFNCLSTSGYVLYLKYATASVKLSKFGMVYYNNLLCMMFLLPIARNQIFTFLFEATEYHTYGYALRNMFAGFMGFFLNFASLNCVANTGPTTYAVVGSINKVPVTFLGYYLFAATITPQTWFFIIVSLCGGFLYSFAKITRGGTNSNNNNKSKTDSNSVSKADNGNSDNNKNNAADNNSNDNNNSSATSNGGDTGGNDKDVAIDVSGSRKSLSKQRSLLNKNHAHGS